MSSILQTIDYIYKIIFKKNMFGIVGCLSCYSVIGIIAYYIIREVYFLFNKKKLEGEIAFITGGASGNY
jgi:hypothetical protein